MSSSHVRTTVKVLPGNIMIKKRYDHLMEISLYTTFYTCVALMTGTFLFSGDEPYYWFEALSEAIRTAPLTTWLCLIGLTMSRAVAMTSKVGVTVHSDAMFNRSLTTVRRVCQNLNIVLRDLLVMLRSERVNSTTDEHSRYRYVVVAIEDLSQ
mmetsp:Transcript_10576/g.10489  ORF Transcript_10576/g.10489 Transcript_10576/m.10489 type:complete len:153 (-) Transcript_10576:439-897(-)